jgi:hypothetical protein
MRRLIWAEIPGYEKYEVSTCGRVRSLNFQRSGKVKEMRARINGKYFAIKISKNGKAKIFYIHQLVAMAFLGHVPNGNSLEVDHIDNNKFNNRLENLQILTTRANITKSAAQKRDLPTGVTYDKARNMFRARIAINGKQKFLGRYKTAEEASEVYQKALKEIL